MGKSTPFLWFDTQAKEAMRFYVSIFKNSHVLSIDQGAGYDFHRGHGGASIAPRVRQSLSRRRTTCP